MKSKIYLLVAFAISIIPFNTVRTLGYRLFFKYRIKNSKIGWLTICRIDSLEMNNASIASFNLFTGPFSVIMKPKSNIGSFNHFKCGAWAANLPRERMLTLEEGVLITTQHIFDLFGNIKIGKGTFIAGIRSQFWTHGGMNEEVDIHIGDNCYIGSGVKFAPGVKIARDSLCAMGSVVTKEFTEKNILIAGVPAKTIKREINWRENWK